MTETEPKKEGWLDRLMERPLQTVWKGLILVSGTSALLSLSELVVKAKGFVVHLIDAYRLLWQEPIQWLAQWVNIPWPGWASDVLLLWAVSNAAGVISTIDVRRKLKAVVRDARENILPLTHEQESSEFSVVSVAKKHIEDVFGDMLHWPSWRHTFFVFFALLNYHHFMNSRMNIASGEKQIIEDDHRIHAAVLCLFDKGANLARLSISRYFVVLSSMILSCVLLLIVSHALVWLPI